MKILVVGTGALACLFAARLARAGHAVTMLGTWQEGLAALRQKGVRLLEMSGENSQYRVEAVEGSAVQGNYKQALVLVKAWQTQRAATQLAGILSDDGIALTLQNGLGNAETLTAALGHDRVALGVTTVGARMIEPGYVQHTGAGTVMIGSHPKLGDLGDLLSKSGFQVEIIANPEVVLWGKLVINAAINPLTALLRVPNGELLNRPTARQVLAEAAQEASSVVAQQGISLPYTDAVAAVEGIAQNTAQNISSMLQDVLRGTPTEIDAINGAIVQTGEKLGVPTPVNRTLWRLVKGLDHP